ncbi:MAG: hypothetical protein AAGA56_19935 [Myxococcota bacterium]
MTQRRFFVTYFDQNYLAKGLAMIASLRRHMREPFHVFVVCLDGETHGCLASLGWPEVEPVAVEVIEAGDTALAEAKGNRSRVEYYWTLTPTIIAWLFARVPEIDVLTYVDADLFFFGDLAPIFAEFGSRSVLIHEHRFSPDLQHLRQNGRFNVGLLCFRRTPSGQATIRRWREQCLAWCYGRAEGGKMGDQGYLDAWPDEVDDLAVLRHPGAGLGPWNHQQYDYSVLEDGRPTVDGYPAIFYHFHAYTLITPDVVVPARHVAYGLRAEVLALFAIPYAEALAEAATTIQARWPEFKAGLFADEVLTPEHTFLARTVLAEPLSNAQIPQPRHELGLGWDVYVSPQLRAPVRHETRRDEGLLIAMTNGALPVPLPGWNVVAVVEQRSPELEHWREADAGRTVVERGRASVIDAVNRVLARAEGGRVAIAMGVALSASWVREADMVRFAADEVVVSASVLAATGGLDSSFVSLAGAIDDWVLRAHAAGLAVRVVHGALVAQTPAADWERLKQKWGVAPQRTQGEGLPASLPPPRSPSWVPLPVAAAE